jgi:hypothetical protein
MDNEKSKRELGRTIVKGVAQHQASRAKARVEDSTVDFRVEAGQKIEDLAGQIRQLGKRFDDVEEAHRLARRLERLADYLQFRPSTEIAADAWEAARRYHLFWIAGGMLGTALLYRILKRAVESSE